MCIVSASRKENVPPNSLVLAHAPIHQALRGTEQQREDSMSIEGQLYTQFIFFYSAEVLAWQIGQSAPRSVTDDSVLRSIS
jgi:hypothetical protein